MDTNGQSSPATSSNMLLVTTSFPRGLGRKAATLPQEDPPEERPNEMKRVDELQQMIAPPLENSLRVLDGDVRKMKISASDPSKRLRLAASRRLAPKGLGTVPPGTGPGVQQNIPDALARVTMNLKANNLALKDRKRKPLRGREKLCGSLDPYVIVRHVEGPDSLKEVYRTATVPKCLDHDFGEVSFSVELREHQSETSEVLIDLVVMNEEKKTSDKEIGTSRVSLTALREADSRLELHFKDESTSGVLILESVEVDFMSRVR